MRTQSGMCQRGNGFRKLLRRVAGSAVLLATLPAIVGIASGEEQKPMGNAASGMDQRAAEVRHLNMRYTFQAPATRRAWEARRKDLREQILVGAGLWPLPEKAPLHARVFGKIEGDGYTVEKVLIETWPGFFLGGNLYRPKGKKGPFPAILNPHGHWTKGRLENTDVCSVPARCLNFARQGFIAFAYDMIGNVDTRQMAHAYKGDDLWGWGALGMQLWDSIRAADFLESLPDVDKKRIGCSGASGGGTQTFLLAAVDDRIRVAAPVNMISGTMQGGCQCENAPLLRLDTNNIEIGAMMAPRPLLMISATGDWTKETPTVEYPAIRAVYALYGAEDRLKSVQIDAGHNYNRASRAPVYAWFRRWLTRDGAAAAGSVPYEEHALELDVEALRGTTEADHPPVIADADFLKGWQAASERQLAALWPSDAAGVRAFRTAMEPAFRHTLAAEWPEKVEGVQRPASGVSHGSAAAARALVAEERLWLERPGRGDRVPALLLVKPGVRAGVATLVVHGGGIGALIDAASGEPKPIVARLLAQGRAVMVIDPFLIGSSQAPAARAGEMAKIGFFTTYNRTDVANRVQDVLTALAYLKSRPEVSRVRLIGQGEAGLWCLLARALAPGIDATVVDAARFSDEDDAYRERLFVPGLRRVGDLRTAATLAAPGRLFIHNTAPGFPRDAIYSAYAAAGASAKLRLQETVAGDEEVLWWLNLGKS
jgi:dienelactone hydrolase